jgi:hypothetical protein
MYPKLENIKLIGCFNCYLDHYEPEIIKTDNCTGKYYMMCDNCGMRTFFDLIKDDNATNTN